LEALKARAKWVEGYRSILDNGRGHSVVVDLPQSLGGRDTGATALELAVMSLAGCISTIFILVAGKMRVKVHSLEVEVDAEKPGGEPTVAEAKVTIRVKTDEPREKVEKVLKHTLANCPVGLLFEKSGTKLSFQLEVYK